MTNLDALETQIDEFIENSGDDISSAINHGNVLEFSHIALIKKNFSYNIELYKNGVIKLTKQVSVSDKSFLESDISEGEAETLLKKVTVKKSKAKNIQDVIEFVMSACDTGNNTMKAPAYYATTK